MLELLSLLCGGVLRLAPEFFKIFTARRDADHEYRMTQLQLEIDRARAQQNIDLAHVQGQIAADAAQMSAMIEALKVQAVPSGVKWVDALSASVRPVLTYWHCIGMYTAYKAALFSVAIDGGITWDQAILQVFTEFDKSVIGSIMSFWFVDRALRR